MELKVSFRTDRETAKRIKEAYPAATLRGGVCEVRFEAEQPAEVEKKAKDLLDKLRKVEGFS